MEDPRLENRKKSFKADVFTNTAKKREELAIKLRKGKKQELFLKKRLQVSKESLTLPEESIARLSRRDQIFSDANIPLITKAEVAARILSEPIDDEELLFNLAQVIKKAMEDEKTCSSEFIKQTSLVPKLDALLLVANEKIQCEVICAIANAAIKSENCLEFVRLGTHKKLIDMMPISNGELTEESLWALKNLIDDNTQTRDLMLEEGILQKVQALLMMPDLTVGLRTSIFELLKFLANIYPFARLELFILFTPGLVEYTLKGDATAMTALACILSCAKTSDLSKFLPLSVAARVSEFLRDKNKELRQAAIYFSGVICQAKDKVLEEFMQGDPFSSLKASLENPEDEDCIFDICYILKVLVVAPQKYLQDAIEVGIVTSLIKLLHTGYTNANIRKHILKCIKKFANYLTLGCLEKLLELKLLEVLAERLTAATPEELKYTIKTLNAIFNRYVVKDLDNCVISDEFARVLGDFDSYNGVTLIMDLQAHPNPEICELATKFFNCYLYVCEVSETFQPSEEIAL